MSLFTTCRAAPTAQTPACLQSGAHIDATPEHLASMPSVDRMLAALQDAHAAKHRITANLPPARVEYVPLPPLVGKGKVPEELLYGTTVRCSRVETSRCGLWAAVLTATEHWLQTWPSPDDEGIFSLQVYQVIVYSISHSFVQQASFGMGSTEPSIQWANAPYLAIACWPALPDSSLSPKIKDVLDNFAPTAAMTFIWDAQAGRAQHSAGPEASAEIMEIAQYPTRSLAWSPDDCNLLLVYGQCDDDDPGFSPVGRLIILDLQQDTVVASTEVEGIRPPVYMWYPAVIWHPTEPGLVIGPDIMLKDDSCLKLAGFALGTLPDPLHISPNVGFSGGGSHLVATKTYLPGSAEHDNDDILEVFTIVACSMSGQQISLTQLCELPLDLGGIMWLPGSLSLLTHQHAHLRQPGCIVTGPFDAPNTRQLAGDIVGPPCPSPSASFFADADFRSLRIADLTTGQQIWDAASTNSNCSVVPGQQRSLDGGSSEASEFVLTSTEILGWLPSGLGLVCSRGSDTLEAVNFMICWFA